MVRRSGGGGRRLARCLARHRAALHPARARTRLAGLSGAKTIRTRAHHPPVGDEPVPDIVDMEDLLEDEISAEEDFPTDLSLTEEEEEDDDVDVFDDKDE